MNRARKPILEALHGERTSPIPFWLMRQAGRYLPEYRALRERAGGFLDLCSTPELAAEATLQPIRRFAMDAAILFSDILVVPQALGQRVWFTAGEGPALEPIRSKAQAEVLRADGIGDRLAPVYRAIALVRAQLPPRVALIGFAGAPWTVATYMVEGGSSRDFAQALRLARQDPAGFSLLLDRLVEATAAHLIAEIEAGAEAVQLFDSWAGSVPEADFDRLVIEPTRRIVEAVRHRHRDVPVIGFPRGIAALYPRYFKETGVDAISIDESVKPDVAAETLQPLGAVQGNLDPRVLVKGGEAMRQATTAIVAALGHGPFVFNLGHGVLPETPPAHVAELAALIRAA